MSRIRADKYTNRVADGAPTFLDGVHHTWFKGCLLG